MRFFSAGEAATKEGVACPPAGWGFVKFCMLWMAKAMGEGTMLTSTTSLSYLLFC